MAVARFSDAVSKAEVLKLRACGSLSISGRMVAAPASMIAPALDEISAAMATRSRS